MVGPDVSTGLRISGVARPELNVFRPKRANGAALLILPGGSYATLVVRSAGWCGPRLNALGYTLFVLTYRLPGEGWLRRSDTPLQDAQRAMRVIRNRAAEFSLDPARVGITEGRRRAASVRAGRSRLRLQATRWEQRRPLLAGFVPELVGPALDLMFEACIF
jgi:hypothetical protein